MEVRSGQLGKGYQALRLEYILGLDVCQADHLRLDFVVSFFVRENRITYKANEAAGSAGAQEELTSELGRLPALIPLFLHV